ncbi:DUF4367 domain-containing protein [Caproiciproducens sp. NJN-50]|uniref:DUF4367 domain-containing protein n=1 Tax=Acutalibacteraceae TaxID=3082771 RepID=UPI000FFE0655|nr:MULTISPECIES: DUF4367 domain-containing protein [Acutalibacteraceae]QAT48496.1 DUF4367 domain-containing protein [Caproiciproducens sp. NJN-50]
MNRSELNRQIFEAMLKAAVNEDFERELRDLPSEKDLTDGCELSPAAKSKIEKAIHQSYRRSIARRAGKTAKRVAVLLAVIIPVALGSLLSVEATRNAIFNAFMDWKSDHIDIHYQEGGNSSSEPSSGVAAVKPKYLPEGFFEAGTVETGSETEVTYQNTQGDTILLRQYPMPEGGNTGIDTEHTTRKEIKIQGENASLFIANSPDDKSYLIWSYDSRSFLLSSKIAPEELVKIAESME